LSAGRRQAAEAFSDRVESVVTRCFDAVAAVSVGNPFTNANKLLDHVLVVTQLPRGVPFPGRPA
jgi:hypothetical protein